MKNEKNYVETVETVKTEVKNEVVSDDTENLGGDMDMETYINFTNLDLNLDVDNTFNDTYKDRGRYDYDIYDYGETTLTKLINRILYELETITNTIDKIYAIIEENDNVELSTKTSSELNGDINRVADMYRVLNEIKNTEDNEEVLKNKLIRNMIEILSAYISLGYAEDEEEYIEIKNTKTEVYEYLDAMGTNLWIILEELEECVYEREDDEKIEFELISIDDTEIIDEIQAEYQKNLQ